MIITNKLKEKIIEKIKKVCNKEIREENNKELLGLTIDYFYDGELIDIGCVVHIFDNDVDEGYTEHISFTLKSDGSDNDLAKMIKKYDVNKRLDITKKIAKEIREYIETVNWKDEDIVRIYEDMFFDLKNYD